jgi:predicted TIM-barrel fold metal-dependent hydrolase
MNELVAEAVKKYPDQFWGLCRVDPWQGEAAVAEVQRGFEELGASGLYLDPWEENFQANDDVVVPVLQEVSRYDKPVVLNAGHLRVSHPTQVRDIASRFPAVKFVACNGGQINISGMLQFEARRMLETCPNVVIQTAGTYREDFLEEITTEVGEERVLFASRSPIYDQEFEMARVRFAHLSQAQKEKLWGLNALRVFGTQSRTE